MDYQKIIKVVSKLFYIDANDDGMWNLNMSLACLSKYTLNRLNVDAFLVHKCLATCFKLTNLSDNGN